MAEVSAPKVSWYATNQQPVSDDRESTRLLRTRPLGKVFLEFLKGIPVEKVEKSPREAAIAINVSKPHKSKRRGPVFTGKKERCVSAR